MIDPVSAIPIPQALPPASQKTQEAAQQFEALMIGQMLKSALSTVEDPAGAVAMELAQEHLAQAMAAQGGLGLARMIASNVEKEAASR